MPQQQGQRNNRTECGYRIGQFFRKNEVKMIAGLGNPGREYEKTPHNVGFVAVDSICRTLKGDWRIEPRFQADVAKLSCNGEPLLLVKPMTYMNASGEAIGRIMHYYRMEPSQIVVVSDDVNLPPGRIRVRAEGGAGGHNGLNSIITHVGTQAFTRVRIGVGQSQKASGGLVGHVLGRITPEHESAVSSAIETAAEAALCAIREGTETAMNRYNASPPDDDATQQSAPRPNIPNTQKPA